MRNRGYRQQGLLVIFLLLLVISVGFAYLNTTLSINGNTKIKGNTWDVHFNNVEIHPGSVSASAPVIDSTNKTSIDYNVDLNVPGEFYEFTVDVVNAGSIDAMIDEVVYPVIDSKYTGIIDYYITYESGDLLAKNDLLKAGKSIKLKVYTGYNANNSNLIGSEVSLELDFSVKYVQADDNAKVIKVSDGFNYLTGDLFSISGERFNVIYSDENNVYALANWNLDIDDNNFQKANTLSPVSISNEAVSITGISYEEYPDNLKTPLSIYKNILESNGIVINDIRLLNNTDSLYLGCGVTCSYPFISNSSFWFGYNGGDNNYLFAYNNTSGISLVNINNSDSYGIRPVISISKSYFE